MLRASCGKVKATPKRYRGDTELRAGPYLSTIEPGCQLDPFGSGNYIPGLILWFIFRGCSDEAIVSPAE